MNRTCIVVCAFLSFVVSRASSEYAPAADAHEAKPFEATSRRSFADVEHWKSVFDDPTRDEWQRPQEVVKALALKPGMSVADLGAGTGYFSRYLSSAVGESGTVFAVEVEPNLIVHLRERAEKEASANVIPILASYDNPRLPPRSVDLVLIVDTFHHIDDRRTYLEKLNRVLKRGGRVVIIDWQKRELPVGPPIDHKLSEEQIEQEMRAVGYELLQRPDILPYQYFLIFRLAGES
jgi:ubiquinone/menaquinone biosynthesis C-methylase UbiE